MLKIGHRGAAGTTPENTEASFREALKRKVDMVEFDVRLTKDGKLVVFHDSDLSRICNEDVAVSMLTLKELKKYDVGSWYNSNYFDEKIVTLQEVINIIGTKAGYNIEIKIEGSEREEAAIKLINLIDGEGIEDMCVVTSFDFKIIKRIKELAPHIKTGVILEEECEDWERILEVTGADGISVNYKFLSEEIVKKIKSRKKFVYTWTVNDSYEIKKIKKLKVDGIISDYPALLKD